MTFDIYVASLRTSRLIDLIHLKAELGKIGQLFLVIQCFTLHCRKKYDFKGVNFKYYLDSPFLRLWLVRCLLCIRYQVLALLYIFGLLVD